MVRILVADSSKVSLAMMKSYLESSGMKVITTSEATRVMALAEQHRPDLIVLDSQILGTNGDDLCRRLRRSRVTSAIPVMVMTSDPGDRTVGGCKDVGPAILIHKSAGREAIVDAVGRALRLPVRRHVRVPCRLSVGLVAPEGTLSGTVHNLSEGGLYLTVATPLLDKQAVHLVFELPAGDGQVSFLGEIVRAEQVDEGGYGYGIAFIEADSRSMEALGAFIDGTIG